MFTDFLQQAFERNADRDAIVWNDQPYSYRWLLDAFSRAVGYLDDEGIERGSVVAIEADFSPQAVAVLLALIDRGNVIVPLTSSVEEKKPEFRDIAEVQHSISVDAHDSLGHESFDRTVQHPILKELISRGHPGLVLFSSGSTGKSKAAVHDLVPMLDKYRVERHAKRAISFLLFDHIGGVNTLLYNLSNGGCTITVRDRSPEAVARAIERHRAQLLPTSPTFINLMLVKRVHELFDLSSLELVTYGTEVMPESTLTRFNDAYPNVKTLQTYGLSEVGILRSKSKSSDSLWVKIGGEGFETRVVDNMLEIKAKSAMLGYLNAPSPFTEDGWFKTGDAVEVDGEYFKILGRKSELINIGGEKIYPAEVESVLSLMQGVEDVLVVGEHHPITGQIVSASVRLAEPEDLGGFRKRMRAFCKDKLPRYAIPQKVVLRDGSLHSERFKKLRKSEERAAVSRGDRPAP